MRIAAYTRYAANSEIKRTQLVFPSFAIRQPAFLEIRHDKAAQAAVNMQPYVAGGGEFAQGNDVVLVAIREIDGGSD